MTKKYLSVIAVLLCVCALFAADSSIKSEDQILNEANLLYLDGKYSKAAEKVNTVIDAYVVSGAVPENVRLMSEAAYSAWLDEILKNKDYASYEQLCRTLKTHPFKVSDQIRKRLDQIYQGEQAYIRSLQNKASVDLNDAEWMKNNQRLEESTKLQVELLAVLNGYKNSEEIQHEQELIRIQKRNYIIQCILVGTAVIILISLCAVVVILLVNAKKRKKIAENFAVMMNVVALLNRDRGEKLPGPDPAADRMPGPLEIPAISDLGHTEDFLNLEKECTTLGSKIDRVTGRKNNSRKVSELVFKMAEKFHVSQGTALVYFCAAMVYDAGFLSIGSNIFEAEHLTVKERYWIRDHVRQAQKYFDFVPEQFLPVFLDAAEYHHENLDGSGYMDGITDKEIPLVARMIHTAESYTSLINRRVYHNIMDRDSAIKEMKSRPGVYDPRTLEALEEIV